MSDIKTILPDAIEVSMQADSIEIEQAAMFIRDRCNQASRSLLEIGHYLLEHFFSNNTDELSDHKPTKRISLRKLAQHPEVAMSYTALSNAVHLAIQDEFLKDFDNSQLTESHRVLLLAVKDPERKQFLAVRVIDGGLSVKELRKLLIENQDILPRGRTTSGCLEPGVRQQQRTTIETLHRGIQSLIKSFTPELIMTGIPMDQLKNLRIEVMEVKKKLEKFIAEMEKRLLY